MSNEPTDKNLGEIFGEFSKTKDTISQVLAALFNPLRGEAGGAIF